MESGATDETRVSRTRKRRLRGWSRLLFAFAVLAALYPALTGVYTWYRQQQMKSGLETGFNAIERVHGTDASGKKAEDPWAGWQYEDAAYWKGLKEGAVFGRLVIPRLGLNVAMVKGVSKEDLKLGPGWAPKTAMPGPTGNVGISGHRTTFLAPFRKIDTIKRGDLIVLESPFRVYTYKVVNQVIVKPDAMGVWDPSKRPIVTLTACHPPYSADERIVTRGVLVKVERRSADATSGRASD